MEVSRINNQRLIYVNEKGQKIEFSLFSPFFLNKIEGIDGLTNTIYKTKGLGQDGNTILGSTLEGRPISVFGAILENTTVNRTKLLSVLNPKLRGRLYYTNHGNAEKCIDCIIENAPKIGADFIPEFLINFYCADPYWQDITENKTEIALWKAKFRFPLIIPKKTGIIMGLKQPSLIINAENDGDVETGIRIEFKARGTVTNPSLFNVETREYIKINKTMVDGEVIMVNTNYGKKKIESILNGVTTNILNLIDLGMGDSFLQLDVGDNLLRYDADINMNNLEINIYFNPKYVGV